MDKCPAAMKVFKDVHLSTVASMQNNHNKRRSSRRCKVDGWMKQEQTIWPACLLACSPCDRDATRMNLPGRALVELARPTTQRQQQVHGTACTSSPTTNDSVLVCAEDATDSHQNSFRPQALTIDRATDHSRALSIQAASYYDLIRKLANQSI